MCGIIAVLGKNAVQQSIRSLRNLENRGYDSAGIGWVEDNKINVVKFASTAEDTGIDHLERLLNKPNIQDKPNIQVCIGHTRWATHGAKTDVNSHPHVGHSGKIMIVHNGIIENYSELKKMLIEYGYTFVSDTDSEVLANLIEYLCSQGESVADALKSMQNMIYGTWGLSVMHVDEPNKVYLTRHGSPLIYYFSDNLAICSSEISGLDNKFINYFMVEDGEVVWIQMIDDQIDVDHKDRLTFKVHNDFIIPESPAPHPHWMIKEIFEQPEVILKAINYGGRISDIDKVCLGGFHNQEKILVPRRNLIILGCGTSLNAGLYGAILFRKISGFDSVQVFDGGKFESDHIVKNDKGSIALFLSQSGETMDLYRCIDICEQNDIAMIGAINVVDSMIARRMLCGVYLNAGGEIAVASTKSFTSQIIVQGLIAVWFAQMRNIHHIMRKQVLSDIRGLGRQIGEILNEYDEIVKYADLFNTKTMFILGKGAGEYVAKEGALKIKEIAYVHAEGFSSSSLKHGPYSLLDTETPVIILCPTNIYKSKNKITSDEIRSRGSPTIIIGTDSDQDIIIPDNETFGDLLCIIPLQILSYAIGIIKGNNVDKPRNLAKCVTTD